MNTRVTLQNVDSSSCKKIILRNLKRIMDIRIIDFDEKNGVLHFAYYDQHSFDQVKNELRRIGHPIVGKGPGRIEISSKMNRTYNNSSNFISG